MSQWDKEELERLKILYPITEFDVCEKIINYIGKSKGTYIRIKSSTNKCWYFRISTKTQINKFYDWMYKDATIFLDRKKEVFLKRKVG